jgi:hypothetical protein
MTYDDAIHLLLCDAARDVGELAFKRDAETVADIARRIRALKGGGG